MSKGPPHPPESTSYVFRLISLLAFFNLEFWYLVWFSSYKGSSEWPHLFLFFVWFWKLYLEFQILCNMMSKPLVSIMNCNSLCLSVSNWSSYCANICPNCSEFVHCGCVMLRSAKHSIFRRIRRLSQIVVFTLYTTTSYTFKWTLSHHFIESRDETCNSNYYEKK